MNGEKEVGTVLIGNCRPILKGDEFIGLPGEDNLGRVLCSEKGFKSQGRPRSCPSHAFRDHDRHAQGQLPLDLPQGRVVVRAKRSRLRLRRVRQVQKVALV